MAFASAIVDRDVMGRCRVVYGTATQASGDTGGAIATGLTKIYNMVVSGTVTSLSDSGGTRTIVTPDPAAAQVIDWVAHGR